MTDSSIRYLVDTNIFLRAVNPQSDQYALVSEVIGRLFEAGHTLHVVPQVIYEFWSTTTRPLDKNGFGWTPLNARARVDDALDLFELLEDSPTLYTQWLNIVVRYRVSGKQVHDARLAAAMQIHQLTHILTLNGKDFERFAEIKAVHPRDL